MDLKDLTVKATGIVRLIELTQYRDMSDQGENKVVESLYMGEQLEKEEGSKVDSKFWSYRHHQSRTEKNDHLHSSEWAPGNLDIHV